LFVSEHGEAWTQVADDPGGPGSRRWLRSGEIETRFLRLEVAGPSAAIESCEVVPIELAASPARHAAALARAAPRGRYPRHLLGEHAPWAVVGGDGDLKKGLLGEDGALEVDAESFSIEPFLEIASAARSEPQANGVTAASEARSEGSARRADARAESSGVRA
jgi:hypothetical protein